MKGSLTIKNGMYYCILYYKDENGVNKQKWMNTRLKERGNKKEAKRILDAEIKRFEKELNKNTEIIDLENSFKKETIYSGDLYSTMSFMKLLEYYVDKRSKIIDYVTTYNYRLYLSHIKNNLEDKDIKVCDVTTETINELYNTYRRKGLSETTIKHYATIINPALKLAYNSRIIDRNPAEMVDPIKREKYRGDYYDANDMEKLFQAIKGYNIEELIKIACFYGFRRSELIGLRWDAIDFENKTITVKSKVVFLDKQILISNKLKTRASHRTLPLIKEVEEMLINIKNRTDKNIEEMGNCYNHNFDSFVFVDDVGELRRPSYVSNMFMKIIKKHNLKKIRFHDLRHSCASLLIANKIPIKQIQEWLGHANFNTTADIYSHLDFNSKHESAKALDNVFSFSKPEIKKEKRVEKVEVEKDLYDEFEEFRKWKIEHELEEKKKKEDDFEM